MSGGLSRRGLLGKVAAGTAVLSVGSLMRNSGAAEPAASAAASATPARTINVVAQRFLFRPNEIPLKAGERVVLAIQSLDFVHGFHVPALNLRSDLMPGQITRVEVQIPKPGQYELQCDHL